VVILVKNIIILQLSGLRLIDYISNPKGGLVMNLKRLFGGRKQDNQVSGQSELISALQETGERLRLAEIGFNSVSDPELVDSSVYEIASLQARYNYLIKKAREDGCEVKDVFKSRKPVTD
jgi:hypothetical protein